MALVGTQTERISASPASRDSSRSSPVNFTKLTTTSPITRHFDRNATIVLIGSRGSGKRSLGFIGATHLGWRLITEDHYFQEVTSLSRKEFLSRYGVKEYHVRNVQVVQKMLHENTTNCIIECGMSSLARATQDTLRDYSLTHPVIYVLRNPDRIRHLLKLSQTEAARLLQADSIHRNISNYEYYNLHDSSCERHIGETDQDRASPNYSSGLKDAKQDFSDFLDFITGLGTLRSSFESQFSLAAVAPEYRPYTYSLNIRLSDLLHQSVNLDLLDVAGGDVMELKIDVVLPGQNMLSVVDKYVALLRRKLAIPVIFKLEPMISNDASQALILLRHALRLGVEYLSIDLQSPDSVFHELTLQKGGTKIIGHYINQQQYSACWNDGTMLTMYQRAQRLGCDIARLLRIASSTKDNDACRAFAEGFADINASPSGYNSPIPGYSALRPPLLIAYNVGTLGHPSQVVNKIFTPVTHGSITKKTASSGSQDFFLTAQEAMRCLFDQGVLHSLNFYICGAAVEHSLSPAMHNAAYRTAGIGHRMHVLQAASLNDLHKASQDPHFGGSGIAQPFKVGIMSHLDAQSHHATAIGAVNTLLPLRALPDGTSHFLSKQAGRRNTAGTVLGWYGDNTDWQGIMTSLRRNVSPRNVVQPSKTTGLVIGSGGMARASIYAMIQLGCRKIFIYNRTVQHAESVAAHFNSWASSLSETGEVVSVLPSHLSSWPTTHNLPTLIVSCIPTVKVGTSPMPNFAIPLGWLQSPTGGVFLELAYKPRLTPLLRQFATMRNDGRISEAWVTVDGLEFIPEQGMAQFELMTGRKAPRGTMKVEIALRLNEQAIYSTYTQIDHVNDVSKESWGGVDAC